MKKVKVYQYSKCSTCRKALKYLDQNKIPYESIPIVEQAPTKEELLRALAQRNGEIRKLFNTSGLVYREMGLSKKIKTIDEKEGIELLSSNGKLVKRPFVLTETEVLIGFKEAEWDSFFKK